MAMRPSNVPEWRAKAPAGISLEAARRAPGASSAGESGQGEPALPEGLSRDLARILRPQAAYRWMLPQLSAISPRYVEMVLRGALAGNHVQAWELFDLMEETSPRLLKNLNEVKRAVAGLDWQLEPWREEGRPPTPASVERARLVNSALRRMRPDPRAGENDFRGTIYDVLDAWGKGVTVLEVEWEVRSAGELGRIVAPRATYWVHPTCYAWSMSGRLGLRAELAQPRAGRNQGAGGGYTLTPGVWQSTTLQPLPSAVAEFPDHKFLISICKAKSGTALGGALLRPLAWWWCAANFSADWLMNLAEVFGLPLRWATYDPGKPQATIDGLCAMLKNLGASGWGAFPTGTKVELKEASRTAEASPQGNLLDRAEKQMDLLILGQTLTTDVSKQGGSRALGDVHAGVKAEVVQAAGSFAAGVINIQLIPSILRLNYGDELAMPEFRPQPARQEDELRKAQRDRTLLDAGVVLPRAWFYARHDIPLPAADAPDVRSVQGRAHGLAEAAAGTLIADGRWPIAGSR